MLGSERGSLLTSGDEFTGSTSVLGSGRDNLSISCFAD
jgi:hypothetical protein